MRAMSSAQMPAGVMPYEAPTSMSASHTVDRLSASNPDLVAEVAGVAGARDGDGTIAQRGVDEPEVLERVDVGGRKLLRGWRATAGPGARGRPCSPRRPRFDVHALRVQREPADVGLGARQSERAGVETADGAVVDDLAVYVAPGRVEHLAHGALGDVARDHAVEEARGVASRDQVLVERRDVEQRRRSCGWRRTRGRDAGRTPTRPGAPPSGARSGRGRAARCASGKASRRAWCPNIPTSTTGKASASRSRRTAHFARPRGGSSPSGCAAVPRPAR